MKSPDTLLLLGSSLTALAVARAACDAGLSCIMVDNVAGPAAATRTAEFRLAQSGNLAGVLACVEDLRSRQDVAVLADSDRWVRFVRAWGPQLEAEAWLVLHPDTSALDICLDKSRFLRWCASNSFSAPRHYSLPGDLANDADVVFPLLLRPEETRHSGGHGLPKAIEVRDRGGLQFWLARYEAAGVVPNVSESLLRAGLRQFSVGAARDANGATVTFLAEKIRPAADQCAGGTYVVPASQPGIEDFAVRVLDALDYFGVAEIEVLYDSRRGQAFLVEINARPWLQYGLPYSCGCDLLEHILKRGGTVARRRTGARAWLYFSSDTYACFSRSTGLVTRRILGPGQYLRSLFQADIYAVWDWRDPLPLAASVWRATAGFIRRFR